MPESIRVCHQLRDVVASDFLSNVKYEITEPATASPHVFLSCFRGVDDGHGRQQIGSTLLTGYQINKRSNVQ